MKRAEQGVQVEKGVGDDDRDRLVTVKLDQHVVDPDSELAVQVPEQDAANRGVNALSVLREPTPGEARAARLEAEDEDSSEESEHEE